MSNLIDKLKAKLNPEDETLGPLPGVTLTGIYAIADKSFISGLQAEASRRRTVDKALISAISILEKIADPRKRDHKEPDAYTQLGCVMHMAQEALDKLRAAVESNKG